MTRAEVTNSLAAVDLKDLMLIWGPHLVIDSEFAKCIDVQTSTSNNAWDVIILNWVNNLQYETLL
jgi:hypothetical protein